MYSKLHTEKNSPSRGLLSSCLKDNEALYRNLYEQYYSKVVGYALKMTGCRQQSMDFAQDVFLKLLANKEKLKSVTNMSSYIFRVCRNQLINDARRKKLKVKVEKYFFETVKNTWITHEQLEEKEYRQLLNNAMHKLPARQRVIYELNEEYNWSRHQIAKVLNLSPFTVKASLQNARKKVREYVRQMAA